MPKAKGVKKDEAAVAGGAADEVMDLKAATEFLKISKPTFYRWLAQDRIKGFKAGQQWRFYRRDLEKFLESEEPIVQPESVEDLQQVIDKARAARGLAPIDWQPTADESTEEAIIARAADAIIADAVGARASDIHLSPDRDGTWVRYRIDGVLTPVMTLPRKSHGAVVSRFKLMADCDITERRVPQNGRIQVTLEGRDYDVRITTMPAIYGEAAVMRLLDQSSVLIGMEKLDFAPAVLKAFQQRLRDPSGLIVITGPSGAGRTTTAYAALNHIKRPEINIITIEDPVEYRIPGVNQVHVNRKAGLTYANAMRYFLRCDPDIILIGELRDLEVAEICMQAAMTGHIVLTTMLPPDSVSVITRLVDMGVEPFLVSASLTAVLAQRLLRKVCPSCKTEYKPSRAGLQRLGMSQQEIARAKFYRGGGCDQCRRTGYYGRTGVFELLEIDDQLRELIAQRAPIAEVHRAATEAGMVTMLQDGLEKAKQGITTVEEVVRVLAQHGG